MEWVWRRAVSLDCFDAVVVATDSSEVREVVERAGGRAVLTSPEHPSGTDRVAEVASLPLFRGYPVLLNLQGDEPFITEQAVRGALDGVVAGASGLGTVATPIRSAAELRDPAAVKVVRGDDGRALLFSRAPIPHLRDGDAGASEFDAGLWLRHIGVYAYAREALLQWVALPEGLLERTERLEQLRPLAAGISIAVSVVSAPGPGIDTPEDAVRADRVLRQQISTATAVSA